MHECLVHEMLNDLADDSTVDVIKLDYDEGALSGQVEYESYKSKMGTRVKRIISGLSLLVLKLLSSSVPSLALLKFYSKGL